MRDTVSIIEVHVFWVRMVTVGLRIVQDLSHVAYIYVTT